MALASSYYHDRLDKLGVRKKALNSETGSYKRGSTTLTGVVFSVEDTAHREISDFGTLVSGISTISFVIDTSEISTLSPATPEIGDTIILSPGLAGEEQFIAVESTDREIWRYTTSTKLRIRINTQRSV